MCCKCKDCTDRHIGCHSECNDYKAFRSNLDKVNEDLRKSKILADYKSEQNKKQNKQKFKKKYNIIRV